jgi:hypothetical protein
MKVTTVFVYMIVMVASRIATSFGGDTDPSPFRQSLVRSQGY